MWKATFRVMVVGSILVSTLLWAADSTPRQPAVRQTTSDAQEAKDPYLNSFQLHHFRQDQTQQDQVPPQKADWSWGGEVTVEPGKPIIAGAIQEEDSVVFLVLVAHLQPQQ